MGLSGLKRVFNAQFSPTAVHWACAFPALNSAQSSAPRNRSAMRQVNFGCEFMNPAWHEIQRMVAACARQAAHSRCEGWRLAVCQSDFDEYRTLPAFRDSSAGPESGPVGG